MEINKGNKIKLKNKKGIFTVKKIYYPRFYTIEHGNDVQWHVDDVEKIQYKQYLVFGYEIYEPNGGMCDFREDFDNLEDIKKFILDNKNKESYLRFERVNILDRVNGFDIELEEIGLNDNLDIIKNDKNNKKRT